ncbi:hypothetical protein T06_7042 [Trichinella sp. T6]|nr:hypothetical protein T06_16666 [Trichinella sp. T6]KRX69215.1 hypothetical protein T06_7042 [Trichinella sp. T6]
MDYRLAFFAKNVCNAIFFIAYDEELHITSSTFVENAANMMVPISGLHCTQDLYVTQASVVKLYSEVYVAFNQNAGDRPCGLKMCKELSRQSSYYHLEEIISISC